MQDNAKMRVKRELNALWDKIVKLNNFMTSENFEKLDEAQRALLYAQSGIMLAYQKILDARLFLWKKL